MLYWADWLALMGARALLTSYRYLLLAASQLTAHPSRKQERSTDDDTVQYEPQEDAVPIQVEGGAIVGLIGTLFVGGRYTSQSGNGGCDCPRSH